MRNEPNDATHLLCKKTGNYVYSTIRSTGNERGNDRIQQHMQRRGSETLRNRIFHHISTSWVRLKENAAFYGSREQLLLLLPVLALMISTATERVTFKMTVDQMFPYKFVMVQIIYIMSCAFFTSTTLYKKYRTAELSPQMLEFPHSKIFKMAFYDTVQFIVMVASAVAVSPTMTVVLMHTSTPANVVVSTFSQPNRKYSRTHRVGVACIASAIVFSLTRIVVTGIGNGQYNCIASSVVYTCAAAAQGLVTLYKEKTITEWSRPINIFYLSSWLFVYQIIVAFGLSLAYHFIFGVFGLDSIFEMYQNVVDGYACFLGSDGGSAGESHEWGLDCKNSLWLILGYVLSNLCILICINHVLQTNSAALSRATVAAVCLAFLALWLYDERVKFSVYDDSHTFVESTGAGDIDLGTNHGDVLSPSDHHHHYHAPAEGEVAKSPLGQVIGQMKDSAVAYLGRSSSIHSSGISNRNQKPSADCSNVAAISSGGAGITATGIMMGWHLFCTIGVDAYDMVATQFVRLMGMLHSTSNNFRNEDSSIRVSPESTFNSISRPQSTAYSDRTNADIMNSRRSSITSSGCDGGGGNGEGEGSVLRDSDSSGSTASGGFGVMLYALLFGSDVGFIDVLCVVLLLVGMEIYGRDPEPDVEVITHYGRNSSASSPSSPSPPHL